MPFTQNSAMTRRQYDARFEIEKEKILERFYQNKREGMSQQDASNVYHRELGELRRDDLRTAEEKGLDAARDRAAQDQRDAANRERTAERRHQESMRQQAESQRSQEQQMQQMMQQMQEQAENIRAAMEPPVEEEGISVDGINSSFVGPQPQEKEFADQNPVELDIDDIDDLHDLSMTTLRPEIIARFEGDDTRTSNFRDLFEGNILRDQLTDDVYRDVYSQLSSVAPDLIEKAGIRVDDVYEKTKAEVDALASYRQMIDTALSAFDLHECGEEIGAGMLTHVENILAVEDTHIEKMPNNLEDLIRELTNYPQSLDKRFSNSKLYFSLLASIYEGISGYGSWMSDSLHHNRYQTPFRYKGNSRANYTLSFLKEQQARQVRSTSSSPPTYQNSVMTTGARGFITEIKRTSTLKKALCCLSNEMIVSGGISRLLGTELGNRYGVAAGDPLAMAFGFDMSEIYNRRGIDIPSIATKPGTIGDFLSAKDNDSSRVVLPFEVNEVKTEGKSFRPGSKFMIEGPARKLDLGFNDSAGTFAANLKNETDAFASYIIELAGLDESTLLVPQGILIRILEDVYSICLEGSKPLVQCDQNVIKAAASLSLSKEGTTMSYTTRSSSQFGFRSNSGRSRGSTNRFNYFKSAGELRFIIKSVNEEEDQPDYRLSLHGNLIEELEKTIQRFGSEYQLKNQITSKWSEAKTWRRGNTGPTPIPGGPAKPWELESEGEIESVFKMIMITADELMSESHNFASRNGKNTSYKNDEGLTYCSNLDYSSIVTIIYHIYHYLLNQLFHWRGVRGYRGHSTGFDCSIILDRDKNRKVADTLFAILNTYKEGGDFNDLFDDAGNALAIEDVNRTSLIGKQITVGDLINTIEDLKLHRSNIKCAISAIKAIADNVITKTDPLRKFQAETNQILTGKVKIDNVKNEKLESFTRLIQTPLGAEALRGLTSMQTNNTMVALERIAPASELEKRQKKYIMTPGVVESLRVFLEQKDFLSADYILCVGLPNGMIDNLRSSTISKTRRQNASTGLGDMKIRFTMDNEFYSSLKFDDVELAYDASLYLLPDSYDQIVSDEVEEDTESKTKSPDPMRNIVNKTVFYRLDAGLVIEKKSGEEIIEETNESMYKVLFNHIFSDLVRIAIDNTLGLEISEFDIKKYSELNLVHMSTQGRDFMKSLIKKKSLPMMRTSVSLAEGVLETTTLDEQTDGLKLSSKKSSQRSFERMSSDAVCDLKRAGQSTLFTAEVDRHRVIGTSMFDRVFFVPITRGDFTLDRQEGTRHERWRYNSRRGNQSYHKFDLAGFVCDVKVT